MRQYYWLFAALIMSLLANQIARAEEIDLTVDSAQSSITIMLLGDSDSSTISGSGRIRLVPPAEPFGTAQMTDLHLVLDDGFFLSVIGGLVRISSEPGDVSLSMESPGPPGVVDQDNRFQQLGNIGTMAGEIDVFDPLNLFIGTGTYDLSEFGPAPFDILDAQLSLDGNLLSVSADFAVEQEVAPGVVLIASGTVVLSGTVPTCADAGTIIEGAGVQGDFAATCGSDDFYWAAHGSSLHYQISDPVVQFELAATAPAGGATALSVDIEASRQSNNAGLSIRAALYNFSTDRYVALPGVIVLATDDAVRNLALPNGSNPADFIEPGSNQLRLLLQTIQTSGLPNVRTRLDQVLFRFE